jgi:tight adherence protein C
MSESILTSLSAFVLVTGGVIMVGHFLQMRKRSGRRIEQKRLRELAAADSYQLGNQGVMTNVVSTLQQLATTVGASQKKPIDQVRLDLLRAGFFHSLATQTFQGARWILVVALVSSATIAALWFDPVVRPLLAGSVPRTGVVPALARLALWVLGGCGFGLLAPSWWLSSKVKKRQGLLRNAFPDALDMIVLCLEGGATFSAAIQRIADELDTVHTELSTEINIVQRQMQLGLSAADALRKFAERCDLAEVRELALVLMQSERYGASLTKTLRGFVETARQDRQQQLEEKAQKAAVKILFPTLLCIFPAIFIVILGPAAFQIARMFSR